MVALCSRKCARRPWPRGISQSIRQERDILGDNLRQSDDEVDVEAKVHHQVVSNSFDDKVWLDPDYCPGGDLLTRLHVEEHLEHFMVDLFPLALSSTVSHSRHIMYRDLKPENIFLIRGIQALINNAKSNRSWTMS